MEEKLEVRNESHILGIIGAVIGGIVCSLPWVIVYVYLNFMWSFLAAIIGYGAFKGYELLKGKMDKSVPYIIAVITILCVVFSTLVIIPGLLLLKEGYSINLIGSLYLNEEFRSAIIKDLLFSLLFAVLGVSGIFRTLLAQAKSGEKLSLKKNKEVKAEKEENK